MPLLMAAAKHNRDGYARALQLETWSVGKELVGSCSLVLLGSRNCTPLSRMKFLIAEEPGN